MCQVSHFVGVGSRSKKALMLKVVDPPSSPVARGVATAGCTLGAAVSGTASFSAAGLAAAGTAGVAAGTARAVVSLSTAENDVWPGDACFRLKDRACCKMNARCVCPLAAPWPTASVIPISFRAGEVMP
jgi:hypothetical protein